MCSSHPQSLAQVEAHGGHAIPICRVNPLATMKRTDRSSVRLEAETPGGDHPGSSHER